MTTGQLRESLEVVHLATEYLKSRLDRKGDPEELKHLEHIEEQLNRAESLAEEILKLPELISKKENYAKA